MPSTRIRCVFVLLCLLIAEPALAQSYETTVKSRSSRYSGLLYTNDPGQYAMGGGTVALRGRPGAVDVNPAAIGKDKVFQTGVDVGLNPFLQSAFKSGQTVTSPFATVKSNRWAAGVQFVQFTYDVAVRAPNGDAIDKDYRHRTFKVFGAYDLSETWTTGTAVGYSTDDLGSFQGSDEARSVTVDLGLHGEWEQSFGNGARLRPSIGVSLTDFGTNSQISDQSEVATPTRLHLGGALAYASGATWNSRPSFRLVGHLAMSKQMVSIERDRSGSEAAGPFAALIKTWRVSTFNHGPSVGVWGQIEKHVGVEVTALDIVSLRAGRNFANDTFAVNNTVIGIGVDFVYLRFDYANTVDSSFEDRDGLSYLRFTASIPLDGTFDRHWW